jgi:hypothetical protein
MRLNDSFVAAGVNSADKALSIAGGLAGDGFKFECTVVMADELKQLFLLIDESYHDYENDLSLVEHTLEVSPRELSKANSDLKQSRDILSNIMELIMISFTTKM